MSVLVLQFIIKQWDKGETSESDVTRRQSIPDRYPLNLSTAESLFNGQVILDRHGYDRMGNKLPYMLTEDGYLLIDKFRICLNKGTVEYNADMSASTQARHIATLNNDSFQCRYDWRYRVEEGGYIYWLYEEVIMNVCVTDDVTEEIFTDRSIKQTFTDYRLS
ncbi:hypothetical protein LCGC14_1333610 [marine sediment metagenome]|uniref:Uncharacterized protein n=1 Tax=marine sediment metagenome TaxID=412755 RepID=A0A0F9KGH9_9ZZZZ